MIMMIHAYMLDEEEALGPCKGRDQDAK